MREYSTHDLVRVAKRVNNNIRSYLYVDPLQGKHIPVSPTASSELFRVLADKLSARYGDERLLVIGFAETATAIGGAVSCFCPNVKAFLCTTRENVKDADYLFFTESHSHASEQRLAVNGFEEYLDGVDRIVFAEDEITTCNTIVKLINVIKERYSDRELRFGVISILNSMTDERMEELHRTGLDHTYICRIPYQYRIGDTEKYTLLHFPMTPGEDHADVRCEEFVYSGGWDQRLIGSTQVMRDEVRKLVRFTLDRMGSERYERVLFLGTEEFMLPGIIAAAEYERLHKGTKVRFHATTRSPIEVSSDKEYPLSSRYALYSLYDDERITFIYDLAKYDRVVIITDAVGSRRRGLDTLLSALKNSGCDDIMLIRWEHP